MVLHHSSLVMKSKRSSLHSRNQPLSSLMALLLLLLLFLT